MYITEFKKKFSDFSHTNAKNILFCLFDCLLSVVWNEERMVLPANEHVSSHTFLSLRSIRIPFYLSDLFSLVLKSLVVKSTNPGNERASHKHYHSKQQTTHVLIKY